MNILDRKIIAGLVVGVGALLLIVLWFFADGFSTSVVDYLNLHGGYALLLLYGLTLALGIAAYIERGKYLICVFIIAVIFAIIASVVGMTIAPVTVTV